MNSIDGIRNRDCDRLAFVSVTAQVMVCCFPPPWSAELTPSNMAVYTRMTPIPDFHEEMDRLQNHIPSWVGLNLKRLRSERAIWVRVPTGVALIGAGVLGFLPLPIVGIWMLPVGLALLAHDIPTMRRPMARLLHFTNRKIEDLRNRSGRSPHWVKVKNPNAPAVRREVEEDWGR